MVESTEKLRRLSLSYLVTPLLAIAVSLPGIMSFPPFHPLGAPANRALGYVLSIPTWFGIYAFPGYVYTWTDHWRRANPGRIMTYWIHTSLFSAVLASSVGAVLMTLTGIFWVFPAISAALAGHMWLRFDRNRPRHRGEGRTT